jgi:hypothetical protein
MLPVNPARMTLVRVGGSSLRLLLVGWPVIPWGGGSTLFCGLHCCPIGLDTAASLPTACVGLVQDARTGVLAASTSEARIRMGPPPTRNAGRRPSAIIRRMVLCETPRYAAASAMVTTSRFLMMSWRVMVFEPDNRVCFLSG